jgi:hypothetical protein
MKRRLAQGFEGTQIKVFRASTSYVLYGAMRLYFVLVERACALFFLFLIAYRFQV